MEKLIINKRHELPIAKKIVWDIITILLWLGFLYLWKPLLIVFYKIITLKAPVEEISITIWNDIESVPFENAVFMLIVTPIILFLLSRINRRKTTSEHLIYDFNDYANYFHLDNAELKQSVNSQFITIYHDEHGNITHLNNKITK